MCTKKGESKHIQNRSAILSSHHISVTNPQFALNKVLTKAQICQVYTDLEMEIADLCLRACLVVIITIHLYVVLRFPLRGHVVQHNIKHNFRLEVLCMHVCVWHIWVVSCVIFYHHAHPTSKLQDSRVIEIFPKVWLRQMIYQQRLRYNPEKQPHLMESSSRIMQGALSSTGIWSSTTPNNDRRSSTLYRNAFLWGRWAECNWSQDRGASTSLLRMMAPSKWSFVCLEESFEWTCAVEQVSRPMWMCTYMAQEYAPDRWVWQPS